MRAHQSIQLIPMTSSSSQQGDRKGRQMETESRDMTTWMPGDGENKGPETDVCFYKNLHRVPQR